MEGNPKNLSDCYFYFYSSCTKGDDCPYRHCEQALGTERVCSLWKEGRCLRSNCKFRHMESRIDRRSIPCYWENQPGGCRKPHCVFFHFKSKACNEIQELILPVSSGELSSQAHSEAVIAKSEDIDSWIQNEDKTTSIKTENDVQSSLEPFVVSFDEESDSESISSTPVKVNNVKHESPKGSNLLNQFSAEKSLDFEIKSLEQIRLEKIHKESADIYKADYEIPTLEDYKKKRVLDVNQIYPPSSDFIGLPSESEQDISLMKEVSQGSMKKASDLRVLLNQPKDSSLQRAIEVPNKVVSIKKEINRTNDHFGFKIKTLDEIKREKMVKKEAEESDDVEMPPTQKVFSESLKKLKIKRKSLNSCATIHEGSEEYLKDRKNVETEKTTDFYCKDAETLPKAKRKISTDDDELKNVKFIKREPSEENLEYHKKSDGHHKSIQKEPPDADQKKTETNGRSSPKDANTNSLNSEKVFHVKRLISMDDDIDNFLEDSRDLSMEAVAEDDILSEINKFLES